MSPIYYIGTSGWHYEHWSGPFYPQELPKKDWLDYYSKHFNTVEINASFYRLPQRQAYINWHKTVPPGFYFSLKMSRFITHVKRLKESEEPLHTFMERAKYLGDKLGPLLYQLPPGFHRDDDRLEAFLITLYGLDKNLRNVFEFRHASWMDEAVFNLLRKYNAGFCIFDMPGFTSPVESTADFAYVRFHGNDELYSGSYSKEDLGDWLKKLQALPSSAKTIYIYFNNDAGGYAIENAQTLRKLIEGR
jgi:uncharacterized protein YecE (DUF72 family)